MHEAAGSLVALKGITKRFGGVRALTGVDLVIDPGEVLGVVGHNGAGKTTLMHVLIGTIRPTSGSISISGSDVADGYNVRSAHTLGIRCVFQEPSLCPKSPRFRERPRSAPLPGGFRLAAAGAADHPRRARRDLPRPRHRCRLRHRQSACRRAPDGRDRASVHRHHRAGAAGDSRRADIVARVRTRPSN